MKGVNELHNIFNDNIQDIQFLLDTVGKDILINDSPSKAIITNPKLNVIIDYDDKYISTLETIKRGDMVTYNDNEYLIITETVTKRASKYKAIMRHCNHHVLVQGESTQTIIGYDHRGAPIYEYVAGEDVEIPCIIENRSFSIDGSGAFRLDDDKVITTFQDNETTRQFKINDTFNVMDRNWKVLNVDKTKVGLLILTVQGV